MKKSFLHTLLVIVLICISIKNANGADAKPFPLNQALTSYFDGFIGPGSIIINYKVEKIHNQENEELYKYYYKITYTGFQPILLQWTVLDRILGGGNVAPPLVFPMTENGFREFTITSKEMPIWADGRIKIFGTMSPPDPRYNYDVLKDRGVSVSSYDIYIIRSVQGDNAPWNIISGPLPPSFANPKFGDGEQ